MWPETWITTHSKCSIPNDNEIDMKLTPTFIIPIAIGSPIYRPKKIKFKKFVVFGDSYSDNGNVFLLTNKTWPISIGGRFSNGWVWPEHLSRLSNAKLVDLAYGGRNSDVLVPGIKQQVDKYLKHCKKKKSDSTLFTVWDAGNDYLNSNYSIDPKLLVKSIMTSINTLYTKVGAINYFVPDLPDLTITPMIRELPELKTKVPNVVKLHNSELKIALDAFEKTNPKVKIYRFPTVKWFKSILTPNNTKITQSGIENTVDACANFYATPPIVCPNPDKYAFWDSVHLTTKIHKLFADHIVKLRTPNEIHHIQLNAIIKNVIDIKIKSYIEIRLWWLWYL
ncbi:3605_t:CDS:2 [Entrophospora sp. SA101]|nr:3605_t:CDS:2 [Entrophospora sp. SA101]